MIKKKKKKKKALAFSPFFICCIYDSGALKSYSNSSKTIRIFHGREVRIESSDTRVTVQQAS